MTIRPNPFEALLSTPSDPSHPPQASDDPESHPPRQPSTSQPGESGPMVPGEILLGASDVEINAGQPVTTLKVVNVSDRPVQIGSHFHFAEVNDALEFDRKAAWGQRLNVLSGGGARFEPGATHEVELIPIRGKRIVVGLRGHCGGSLDE